MAVHKDREHFIPIRSRELVDLLCADKDLKPQDRDLFRQFCRLVMATLHFEYDQRLEELKDAYAPFDPDRDCKSLLKINADERQLRQAVMELEADRSDVVLCGAVETGQGPFAFTCFSKAQALSPSGKCRPFDAETLAFAGAVALVAIGLRPQSVVDVQGADRACSAQLDGYVEHLTGLGQLPPTGSWFTAAPIPLAGFGSFPTRAYGTIPQP